MTLNYNVFTFNNKIMGFRRCKNTLSIYSILMTGSSSAGPWLCRGGSRMIPPGILIKTVKPGDRFTFILGVSKMKEAVNLVMVMCTFVTFEVFFPLKLKCLLG